MTKLTGIAAIDYAEENGLPLNKYADPIEDARDDLSIEEAREVAREDASLIWLDVEISPKIARRLFRRLQSGDFDFAAIDATKLARGLSQYVAKSVLPYAFREAPAPFMAAVEECARFGSKESVFALGEIEDWRWRTGPNGVRSWDAPSEFHPWMASKVGRAARKVRNQTLEALVQCDRVFPDNFWSKNALPVPDPGTIEKLKVSVGNSARTLCISSSALACFEAAKGDDKDDETICSLADSIVPMLLEAGVPVGQWIGRA